MKSSYFLFLIILVFSVSSLAQELDRKDVEQVLGDANQGNPKAQAYLGGMYYYGNGVPLNHNEAAKWWRRAAEQGNAFGQLNLGRMFSRGEGMPQNHVEAAKWFQKAVEQGNIDAGKELKAAVQGQDHAGAINNRLRQAAEEGGAVEQVRLGAIYQYGRNGVTKDRAEAMKWYRKAADQGDAHGQIELGDMFYFGSIATQNYVEAAKWYRKAAETGSMHGQEKLGSLYRHGEGVDKDLKEAEKWFRMAAGQGNLHARRALYEMSNKGKIEIAFKELSQTVKILLFLLLWFPVWWLIAGYFFNCPPKCLNIIVIVIFLGGVAGFLVTFACNGGAGGSSEMRASAWGCLLPYMAVHNIALALVFFSGLRKKEG